MPQQRKYFTNAARQKAYRLRANRNTEPLHHIIVPRPAIRWLGGKWRIGEWIISQLPPHRCYCEPFGGGANVLLQKPPSRLEVYNDLDGDVVNFFAVLRANPEKLIRQIELTPFARDELIQSCESTIDPMERARRFYVRCWQSFQAGSGYDRSPSWRFQKDWARGKSTLDEWNTVEHLGTIAGRFKLVQIENRPAEDVINRFDGPSALFYVDPPYLHDTRSMATQTRYRHEMTEEDHRRLAAVLSRIEGMAIVSGYESRLYDELYSGWARTSKTTTTNGNSVATEYLWLSPKATEIGRLPLFIQDRKYEGGDQPDATSDESRGADR